MNFREPSTNILSDLVDSLSFPVIITGYVNNGGGTHTLTMCNMYHAQTGFKVTIGGKQYKITSITPGTFASCGNGTKDVMTVIGDQGNITATTFNMYKPHFFYGTPIAQGEELSKKNKAVDKVPMFWLRLDDFQQEFFEDFMLNKEREIKMKLYALTQGKGDKIVTDQATREAVNPMIRMMESLVAAIVAMPWRFDANEFSWSMPAIYPRFGVISINRGVEKSWWHDQLSGCGSDMNLTVFRKEQCDDCAV